MFLTHVSIAGVLTPPCPHGPQDICLGCSMHLCDLPLIVNHQGILFCFEKQIMAADLGASHWSVEVPNHIWVSVLPCPNLAVSLGTASRNAVIHTTGSMKSDCIQTTSIKR